MNSRSSALVVAMLLAVGGCHGSANTAATATPAREANTGSPPAAITPARTPIPAPTRPAPPPPPVAPAATRAPLRPALRTSATPRATAVQSADTAPRIFSVDINSTNVGSGDTVSGSVRTSLNVASVEIRVATFGMSMTKVGAGHFELSYTVGNVPFFLHGTYTMQIIARNTRGDAVERTLPLTVH